MVTHNQHRAARTPNYVHAAMTSLQTEIEAYAFRQLVAHLRERTDVQNVDLMNLSGFCRNCLSKWYLKGSRDVGLAMDYDHALEAVYGEPYGGGKGHTARRSSTTRASSPRAPELPRCERHSHLWVFGDLARVGTLKRPGSRPCESYLVPPSIHAEASLSHFWAPQNAQWVFCGGWGPRPPAKAAWCLH